MTDTNWKEALPAELQSAPYFKSAETVEQVLADLTGAAAWQGNSLRIPGPDTTPEQKAEFAARAMEKIPGLITVPDPDSADYGAFFKKLGMPDDPNKYKVPEEHGLTGDQVGQLKAQAHAMNMTQKQFDKWVGSQLDGMRTQTESAKQAVAEQQALIRTEWGAATEFKMSEIGAFLDSDTVIPADLKAAFKEGRLSAEYVKFLHHMAGAMSEGGEIAKQDGGEHPLTPLEAKEQFHELTQRLVAMRSTDARYMELVNKRAALAGMMNPQ
jgi:hypothetical protein